MRIKKNIQVRNVGEFRQWAKSLRVQIPTWTLSCERDYGRPDNVVLTYRPLRNKYKITNKGYINPSIKDADKWLEYTRALKLISTHGTEEARDKILLFGFHIIFKEDNDLYNMFSITMDKGREKEVEEIIKMTHASKI